MTLEQLRSAHRDTPFRPFTIRMADGRSFPIPHPDFLHVFPTGRIAVVWREDGTASILDVYLMTELDLAAPAGQP